MTVRVYRRIDRPWSCVRWGAVLTALAIFGLRLVDLGFRVLTVAWTGLK
jgi:hypothetical protein